MLVITLGVRYAEVPRVLVLDEHPPEFNPEVVFEACNRIEDDATDIANLRNAHWEWAIPLREGLDPAHAPSMSVDDTVQIFAVDGGVQLGGWRVEARGWVALDVDTSIRSTDTWLDKHVHICIPSVPS